MIDSSVARSGAASTSTAWPEDAIEVGRVLDGWGIKGWIKVQPYAVDAGALVNAKHWFLKPPEAGPGRRPVIARQAGAIAGAARPLPPSLNVLQSRLHGDWVVAFIEGIADRTAAESLRGARVFVSRAGFPKPAEGEYYWIDLIGLAVVNLQGESLGEVLGLIDTGPQSVIRVAPPGTAEESETMIPFVGAYVIDVDMTARRITVDWGLDWGVDS